MDIDSSKIVEAMDTASIPEPIVEEMKKVEIPKERKEEVENEPWKITQLSKDIASWGSRAAVKYVPGVDAAEEGEALETKVALKGAEIVEKGPQENLSMLGQNPLSPNPRRQFLGAVSTGDYEDYVPPTKNKKVVESSYTNLDPKGKSEFYTFSNEFDGREGFNYVPISNIGNSTYDTKYENVEGIAHFLLDSDVSGDENFSNAASRAMVKNQLSGKPAQGMGSTVKDFYFPVGEKNEDGTINIKYLKKDEIEDTSKIISPLRQYKFSDFDWRGKTSAQGFNSSVASVPTKKSYTNSEGKKSNQSHFLFPSDESFNGKQYYNKYGGGSVVFIADTPKGRRIVEVAGTIDTIHKYGVNLMKQEGISADKLIIGYHDVGSFSAKPKANNGTLNFTQWSGYNSDGQTGGGLAIPKR